MNYNNFKIAGYLVGKAITLGKNKDTKMPWLMATLTVEVGENKRVELNMFANEKTSSGNENKIYKSLMTIKDEYKSLNSTVKNKRLKDDAEAVKDESTTVASLEECEFIRCNKGIVLQMNRYMRDGELMENFRLSVNFVNRVTSGDRTPIIEGALTGVIESKGFKTENGIDYPTLNLLVPEYRDGYTNNKTGEEVPPRIVVERFPLILRMEDQDALDYFDSEFDTNVVVNLGIEPTNEVTVEEKKQETKKGFGRVATFSETKVVRELRITGGWVLEEDEYKNENEFNFDLFGEGVERLNASIEELKDGGGKSETIAPRGFGKQNSSSLPF